jgi:Asp-tRNA(Asn)/Glu-tRNA(Gln) amidotransferase A subunit family amidase
MTDKIDNDPNLPDAFEVAAKEDEYFAKTGKLIGPLHGVFMAIKDQYDTADMRSTSGADAFYANDRPPHDATFIARLRAAGAIILAKANLGEYATGTPRSSFGGAFVNPYDTERSPSGSSSGSGSSVAANFVTCAIAEETTSSIRGPAHWNNCVGIAGTQELVPRTGMIQMGINTRVGPIARTVEDAARILTVIAGYDPQDELTAFGLGRLPKAPYESFTHEKSLSGMRIGVVREYMDKALFTKADEQSIDLVNKVVEDLRGLGATIVDPGEHGELFTKYIQKLGPMLHNSMYTKLHPDQFPVDATGKPTTDQIMTLVDIYVDPSKATGKFTLRDLGGAAFGGGGGGGGRAGGRRAAASAASGAGAAAGAAAGAGGSPGEGKFTMDVYLRERGDANIKTLTDLINKANWADDPAYNPRKPSMESADKAMVLDTATRMQRRFAVQQIILQAFADQKLDAVVYPTGNLPPSKLGQPTEPNANGRGQVWTFLGMQGFPAMTVPCGFTTEVYDRVPVDPKSWPVPRGEGAGGEYGGATVPTNLVGPIPAKLPVGVDFLGIPFSEPTLLKIAAAYESVSPHRMPPPDFGPLKEGSSAGVQ